MALHHTTIALVGCAATLLLAASVAGTPPQDPAPQPAPQRPPRPPRPPPPGGFPPPRGFPPPQGQDPGQPTAGSTQPATTAPVETQDPYRCLHISHQGSPEACFVDKHCIFWAGRCHTGMSCPDSLQGCLVGAEWVADSVTLGPSQATADGTRGQSKMTSEAEDVTEPTVEEGETTAASTPKPLPKTCSQKACALGRSLDECVGKAVTLGLLWETQLSGAWSRRHPGCSYDPNKQILYFNRLATPTPTQTNRQHIPLCICGDATDTPNAPQSPSGSGQEDGTFKSSEDSESESSEDSESESSEESESESPEEDEERQERGQGFRPPPRNSPIPQDDGEPAEDRKASEGEEVETVTNEVPLGTLKINDMAGVVNGVDPDARGDSGMQLAGSELVRTAVNPTRFPHSFVLFEAYVLPASTPPIPSAHTTFLLAAVHRASSLLAGPCSCSSLWCLLSLCTGGEHLPTRLAVVAHQIPAPSLFPHTALRSQRKARHNFGDVAKPHNGPAELECSEDSYSTLVSEKTSADFVPRWDLNIGEALSKPSHRLHDVPRQNAHRLARKYPPNPEATYSTLQRGAARRSDVDPLPVRGWRLPVALHSACPSVLVGQATLSPG